MTSSYGFEPAATADTIGRESSVRGGSVSRLNDRDCDVPRENITATPFQRRSEYQHQEPLKESNNAANTKSFFSHCHFSTVSSRNKVLPPLGNNAHRSGHVRKASDAARSTASVSSTTSASSPNRRPGDTVSALNDTEMSSADLESKLSQIFALQDRTFNMTVSLDKLSSFAAGEIIAKLDRVQERLDQIERNQQEQLREIQNLQSLTLSKKGRKQLRRQLENDQRRTNIGQMDAKDPKHNSRSPRLEESTDIEDPTGRRDRQLMMQQVKGCSLHDDEAAVKGLQKLSNLYKRSEHGKSGGIHWFRKSK